MVGIPKEFDDVPYRPPELEQARFSTGGAGRAYAHLLDLKRRQGLRPGARIEFPEIVLKEEFWEFFPREELAFRHFVFPQDPHDPGILYLPPVMVVPEVEFPRDEYEGLARLLVELLHQRWVRQPAEFEARFSRKTVQAVRAYATDLEAYEQAMFEAEWETFFDLRPPTPPGGYFWQACQVRGEKGWVLGVGEDPEKG